LTTNNSEPQRPATVLRLLAFIAPLSLESFAVAAALGAAGPTTAQRWRITALFVAFEGGMPMIGPLAGGPSPARSAASPTISPPPRSPPWVSGCCWKDLQGYAHRAAAIALIVLGAASRCPTSSEARSHPPSGTG